MAKTKQKLFLSGEELREFKAKSKLSIQGLANYFEVSVSTIKRRLKTKRKILKDAEVMRFANKLQELARVAPNEPCRRELLKTINFLRTNQALPCCRKKEIVFNALESGARDAQEISSETNIYMEDLLILLEEMVLEGSAKKEKRGGKFNSGRKTKFYYYPAKK